MRRSAASTWLERLDFSSAGARRASGLEWPNPRLPEGAKRGPSKSEDRGGWVAEEW